VLAWAMSRYSGGTVPCTPAGLLIAALGAGGLVVAAASPGYHRRVAQLGAAALGRRAVIRHLPMALAGHRDRSRDHRAPARGPLAWAAEAATAITLAACLLDMDRTANPAPTASGPLSTPGTAP